MIAAAVASTVACFCCCCAAMLPGWKVSQQISATARSVFFSSQRVCVCVCARKLICCVVRRSSAILKTRTAKCDISNTNIFQIFTLYTAMHLEQQR